MALKHDKDGFLVGRGGKDILEIIHDNTEEILAHVKTPHPKTAHTPKLTIGLKLPKVTPSKSQQRKPRDLSHGLNNRDAKGRFIGQTSTTTDRAQTKAQNKKINQSNTATHKAQQEQIKLLKRMANKNNGGGYKPTGNALLGKGLNAGALDFAKGSGKSATRGAGKLLGGKGRLFGAARMGGKLMRRIPVLGSLLGLGAAAWAAHDIDSSSLFSADKGQQKAGMWGKAGGGLAGAAAGGAAGAAFGSLVPVVGTAVGGLVGAVVGGLGGEAIGQEVGEWLYKKDWKSAWDQTRDGMSSSFDSSTRAMTGFAQNAFDSFKATFPTITASIASMTKTVQDTVQATKDAFNGNAISGANPDGSPTIAQRIGASVGHGANYVMGAAKDSLAGFIGKGEGDYNSVNLGKAHGYKASKRNLTGMRLEAVLAGQNSREYNAVGKYQIIRDTMPEVIKGLGLTGKEVFDERLQDQMGAWLAFHKRKSLGGFLSGKHNDINAAGDDAAREWASLPVFSQTLKTGKYHSKRGSTAYSDGVNKASHTVNETQKSLFAAKAAYQAAIQSGKSKQEAEYLAFTGLSHNIGHPTATKGVLGSMGNGASALGSELDGYLAGIKKVGVQCVDLVKASTGIAGSTQNWQRGQAAEQGTLKQGDALATFLSGSKKKDYSTYALSDKYGGGTGGAMGWNKDHAVIFDKYNYDKAGKIESMSVFEQYKGTNGKVVPNTYKFNTGVNNEKNASMYYAINVAGKALKVQKSKSIAERSNTYDRVNDAELNKGNYPAGGVDKVQASPSIASNVVSPSIQTPSYLTQPIVAPNITVPSSPSKSTQVSVGNDSENSQAPYIVQKPIAQRVSHEKIAWTVSGGIGMG